MNLLGQANGLSEWPSPSHKSVKDNQHFTVEESHLQRGVSGCLRLLALICAVTSTVLAIDFHHNFVGSDKRTLGFFIFSSFATTLYLTTLTFMEIGLQHYKRSLELNLLNICTGFSITVFLIASSSLLGDYVKGLRDQVTVCDAGRKTTCEHLVAATVLGFVTACCLIGSLAPTIEALVREYLRRKKILEVKRPPKGPL